MKKKSDCCKRFKKKPRPCKSCPLFAGLGKKRRRKLLKTLRR